ncbi:MAG: 23S rRNA (adenine(2503)-C(2))-methyltransferase RlmN [Chloroflexi bacterium]|nr:23S rRNA (adenine(2503)-C(2))-methyltransferase RlmN [Chloroflexota bacterium]
MDLGQLRQQMLEWQQPAYRAGQLYGWIYKSLVADYSAMHNLPAGLRAQLAASASWPLLQVVETLDAADGSSTKALLRAADGQTIETVILRYPERNTVCISSQVGCALGCVLCATGQAGFIRDLSAGEMVAQVLYAARALRQEGRQLTNVVLMGMGEPLLNYEAACQALNIIMDPAGLGMGARRITLSTAGVVPGIRRLAEDNLGIKLAISLHAPNDTLRAQLIPLNRKYPLASVIAAVHEFISKTSRRVTFEYVMVDGINDSPALAYETAELLRGLFCHVNLIGLYPTERSAWRGSSDEAILDFQAVLLEARIPTTIRVRRGEEITGGCGQLRFRELSDDDD